MRIFEVVFSLILFNPLKTERVIVKLPGHLIRQ